MTVAGQPPHFLEITLRPELPTHILVYQNVTISVEFPNRPNQNPVIFRAVRTDWIKCL